MEHKKEIFVVTLVLLIIGGMIVGSVILLTNFFRGVSGTSTSNKPVTGGGQQVVKTTSAPVTSGNSGTNTQPAASVAPDDSGVVNGKKTITVASKKLSYPATWGLLKCSNTDNFEFDPTNPTDQTAVCTNAVKPVTVLITSSANCLGETIQLGGKQVVRNKNSNSSGSDYRWCVSGGTAILDITHRVSSLGYQAYSKDDYSAQIEEMITNYR